jgi:hypothetical protein
MYNYHDVFLHEITMQFLYKPIKIGFDMKFVWTYEA